MDATATAAAAELGALLGISDRAVRDMAKAGHVVVAGRGKYDVAASVPRYCAHLRSLATGRGGEAAQVTAARERARLASAQADKAELGNARLRGSLLDAGDVERTWTGILAMVRAGVLAAPARVQQRLPHLTRSDIAEIDAEIRSVLAEIGSNDPGNERVQDASQCLR